MTDGSEITLNLDGVTVCTLQWIKQSLNISHRYKMRPISSLSSSRSLVTGRTDWTARFWRAWRTGLLFAILFMTSASALAQTYDPTEQPQIDFSEEANKRKPIPASKITPVSLKVHWNLYKEVVRSGKSGNDQLNALRDDAISVGQRNLPATTFAAIRLVQDRRQLAHDRDS